LVEAKEGCGEIRASDDDLPRGEGSEALRAPLEADRTEESARPGIERFESAIGYFWLLPKFTAGYVAFLWTEPTNRPVKKLPTVLRKQAKCDIIQMENKNNLLARTLQKGLKKPDKDPAVIP
jgi:hypothetical protein